MTNTARELAALFQEVPPRTLGVLDLAPLQYALKRVLPVIPPRAGRYTCSTGHLEATGEMWQLVATDSHRLVVVSQPAPVAAFTCDIPVNVCLAFKQLKGKTVKILETDKQLFFTTEQHLLPTDKYDDKPFPPTWRRMLPTEYKTTVKISDVALRRMFHRILPLVPLMSNSLAARVTDSTNSPFWLAVSESGLAVAPKYNKIWCREEALVTGPAIECRMNFQFLMDFVTHAVGEVEIRFIGPGKVVDFHNGPDYRYLQVPL